MKLEKKQLRPVHSARDSFNPGDRIHYGGAVVDQEEIDAILETILESDGYNWVIGRKGTEFENLLENYTGKSTVLTNSGSSALLLALLSLNLPKGSRVILPATTFPTALSAIHYAGLVPLFVDSDTSTFNMDIEKLESALTQNGDAVSAVIYVNVAGNIGDMDRIIDLWNKYELKLILDNCDGFGGTYQGRPVESYSDVACTSFHAAHIISMGEGGAVFFEDKANAEQARKYRDWGRMGSNDHPTGYDLLPKEYPQRYTYEVLGFNLKPLELQAAMGIVQFSRLKYFKELRDRNFSVLKDIFFKHYKECEVVVSHKHASPSWFSFPILTSLKDELVSCFESANIETRSIFAGNMLRHPAMSQLFEFTSYGTFEGSNEIMRKGMFIGLSPRTTVSMLEHIESVLKNFVREKCLKLV